MESPGDSMQRIHLLGLMLVILTTSVHLTPVQEYNELWERSDLIVEGTITDVKIRDGRR